MLLLDLCGFTLGDLHASVLNGPLLGGSLSSMRRIDGSARGSWGSGPGGWSQLVVDGRESTMRRRLLMSYLLDDTPCVAVHM